MTPGVNLPADTRIEPQQAKELGASWVRVVLLTSVDLSDWMSAAHELGLDVIGVIARESLATSTPYTAPPRLPFLEFLERIRTATGRIRSSAPVPTGAMPYAEAAQFYASRYGHLLQGIIPGNEPDLESPSSWTMTPEDLNQLIEAVFEAFPVQVPIIGPGLASGQPSYLDDVDITYLDSLNLHPYGRRPNDTEDWSELPGNFGTVQELFDAYARFELPIWVGEWGVTTTEVTEQFQARYTSAMMPAMAGHQAALFCYDDTMVPEFGVIDINGYPKLAADAYTRAAAGGDGGNIMPAPDYEVGQGVLAEMATYGDEPGSDECYYPVGVSPSQWSETMAKSGCIYRYLFATNTTYRFPPA